MSETAGLDSAAIPADADIAPVAGSEPYEPDNLLDRLSRRETLEGHYRYAEARERAILARRLPLAGGQVLSVGAGWHPGRHLFPAPEFHLVAVDADPDRVAGVRASARADAAAIGYAGRLPFDPASFDVVLYRLVLHHLVFQGPLGPVFAEAASLLRPGGALVAVEPGRLHPVGAALAFANRVGVASAVHGTPDDVPLAPGALVREAHAAGLRPELHAVTYAWRRLGPHARRPLTRLDAVGSRPRAAPFGHTLMLIARKPAE